MAKASAASPLVVIYVHPVIGRFNPALLLASRIATSENARVLLVYPNHLEFRLSEAKSRVPDNADVHFLGFSLEGAPEDSREFNFAAEYKLISSEFCSKLETFLVQLPHPPACLITDEVSAPVTKLAHRLNIRNYVFVPESALALSAALYAPKLAEESRLPLPFAPAEADLLPPIQIPSVATLKVSEFLTPYSDKFPTWLMNLFLESAVAAQNSDGLLVNTYTELEPVALSGLKNEKELNPRSIPVIPIGPLIPDDDAATVEHECFEFLDRQPPASVIFVAFGSLRPCSGEDEVREIHEGLKASGYPFIWMLRCSEDLVPQTAENGMILRNWAPQLQILSHPSTGAFLSHCGWNSTIESLSRGIPVLGSPMFMDQHINMKLIEENGAGMKLAALERGEIESSLKELMESKEKRHAAQKLKFSATLADPCKNLKCLVERL